MTPETPRQGRDGLVAPDHDDVHAAPCAEAGEAERYTIGELAEDVGVTTRAIRFYESRGLISPQRKGVARAYTRRDRARLLLILRGKNLGFTLEDIGAYLELYDADPTQVAQMRLLKAKIEAHIEALEGKRADLERTLTELAEIKAQVSTALADRGE
jgi:DNA-binding transcriptional MerR regulator